MDSWFVVIGAALYLAMTIAGIRSAYSNGACDGYGYARDCTHPGYQKAGEFIYQFMGQRYESVPKPGSSVEGTFSDANVVNKVHHLRRDIDALHNSLYHHHKGMIDIAALMEKGDIEGANEKVQSFLYQGDGNGK